MSAIAPVATVVVAVLLGVVVPWSLMRMLSPSLAAAPAATTTNYRGMTVHYGLGVVWLVWAGAAIVGGVAGSAMSSVSILPALTLAGPLALVAFALGLVDDVFGTGAARGFRGHLSAMARGRLTTGGLKLVGIGLSCLVVAAVASQVAPWGVADLPGVPPWIVRAFGVLVAGAAIALTSNFVNLMDLRPGRALKSYSVLALFGAASAVTMAANAPTGLESTATQIVVDAVSLLVFLWGPVVAVWRSDLGERGMLGDAGANPMGAVAGMFIVLGLPLWGLLVYAGAMFGLNLASERVSYSRVIEASPVLAWLDGLGRLRAEMPRDAFASELATKNAQPNGHDGGSQK